MKINLKKLWILLGFILIISIAGSQVTADTSITMTDSAGQPYDGVSYPVNERLVLLGNNTNGGALVWNWTITGPTGFVLVQNLSQNITTAQIILPGSYTINLAVTLTNGTQEVGVQNVNFVDDTADFGVMSDFTYAIDRITSTSSTPVNVTLIDQSQLTTGTRGSSSGERIVNWYWTLDNVLIATGVNTVVLPTPVVSGPHTMGLRIDTNLGKKAYTQKQISILPNQPNSAPTAKFTVDKLVMPAPGTVTFSDLSTGLPTSWKWDFGDGQTSNLQSPIHVYKYPGHYIPTLIVSNVLGQSAEYILPGEILVQNSEPSITAEANISQGLSPLAVQFTAFATVNGFDVKSSMDLIKEWTWYFGDKNINGQYAVSHEQNPVYVYEKPGIYLVNVTCTLQDGVSKTVGIPVKNNMPIGSNSNITVNPLPLADYYWEYLNFNESCCYLVKFTDISIDANNWQWNFDDGSQSSDRNPTHRFKEAGNYNVSLTVSNKLGNIDAIVKTVPITVGYAQPANPRSYDIITADFSTVVGLNSKSINFLDQSTGIITQWEWNFGDGTSLVLTNNGGSCVHTYQKFGSFTVKLTASNPIYSDSTSRTIGIR